MSLRVLALAASVLVAPVTGPAPGPSWAVAVLPSGFELSLEIADTPRARARGYMGREDVGEGEGMLLVFGRSDHHGIWMKNCKVPLDILWLDEDLRVVEIARRRPPCVPGDECPTMVPMRRARYVLEAAAGTADRHEIRLGSTIRLLSDLPVFP